MYVYMALLLLLLLLLLFNCNWVDTRWHQYSTHLHTISTQNTEDGTYITITRDKTKEKKEERERKKRNKKLLQGRNWE
jgi:hypothetical protein